VVPTGFPLLRLLSVTAVLLALPSSVSHASVDLTVKSRLTVATVGAGNVVSVDGHLRCGARCSALYPRGTVVGLHALDTPNFAFDAWLSGCVGELRTCYVQTGSVSRVRALFHRKRSVLNLTVGGSGIVRSTPPGINCGHGHASCRAAFGRGTVVALTAHSAAGNAFQAWGGPCTGAQARCAVRMSSDRAGTAGFGPIVPSLTAQIAVKFAGPVRPRVVSEPAGIDCRKECSASFPPGTQVTLHTTFPGAYGRWYGACEGVVPTCPLVADSSLLVDVSVSIAAFTPPVTGPPEFGVNVSVSGRGVVVGGGQINCGRRTGTVRACAGYFGKGSIVVLRALPAKGAHFGGWSGFCSGKGHCRLTVNATKLVYAVFGR
jgi:hypothetical protein